MDIQDLGGFAAMVVLLTIMPGPNGALLLKTVPQFGRPAGFLNLTGIISAFAAHGAISVLGISALILSSSKAFLIVKLLGALYLLYLGGSSLWQAFSRAQVPVPSGEPVQGRNSVSGSRRLFLEGFLTNLLNPKVSMFYLAAFPQFISPEGSPVTESLVMVLIHSVVVIAWFSFIIVALGAVSGAVTSTKFRRVIQGSTGSIMLWFGYHLLTYQQ
ncbi:LysE family translocator [Pseudomaricurvus alkylphenolicus]|uniref:LysE family translocator n=1 Tax=Pseudomaricurvus alkylphenolicus TaxID=1306991 RepID=UPI001422357E|nr:LysE family translocator [Pseudomaricurvus alkylphenolicus]NIB44917.1 LysE family translocator [Pseudomaricurvus alkylphenolicus]